LATKQRNCSPKECSACQINLAQHHSKKCRKKELKIEGVTVEEETKLLGEQARFN
jgi:hypothetical protein